MSPTGDPHTIQLLPSVGRRPYQAPLLLLATACCVLLSYRFGGELLVSLQRASAGDLWWYFVLGVVVRAGYVWRWRRIAGAMGTCAASGRLTVARLAADGVAAVAPAGRITADPLRVWLTLTPGERSAPAAATVTCDRWLEVQGNAVAAIVYVIVFAFAGTGSWGAMSAAFVALTGGFLALAALAIGVARGRRPLAPFYRWAMRSKARMLRMAATGVWRVERHLRDLLRARPGVLLGGLAISIGIEAVIVVEHWFLFRAFGMPMSIPLVMLSLIAGGISHSVPTPGALGALEAGQVMAFAAASGRPEVGFTLAVATRVHELLWAAIGCAALVIAGFPLSRLRYLVSDGKRAA